MTGLARRKADIAIQQERVTINGHLATPGQDVSEQDEIRLDGQKLAANVSLQTIILNKPVGYVCSRRGQGSKTIYDLLPDELDHLKPVGRLDKDSSGLLLLTNDGELANELTHPKFSKTKLYEIELDKALRTTDKLHIGSGVQLDDGISRLKLTGKSSQWLVSMQEGRNRQIRRTFAALGYRVVKLRRTAFGDYALDDLPESKFKIVR